MFATERGSDRSRTRRGTVVAVVLVATAAFAAGVGLVGPVVVGAAVAVGGGLVVLAHPLVGLVALAFVLPLEEMVMLGGATVPRLLMILVAVVWIVHTVTGRRSIARLVRSPILIAAVLLVALIAVSAHWSAFVPTLRTELLKLGVLLALAVVTADLVSSWERGRLLARTLVVGGAVAAVLAIGQYYGVGVRRAGEGISGGINTTATMLVLVVPLGFYLLRADRGAWRLLGGLYVGLAVAGVAVTFSRMNYLMLALLLGVELWGFSRTLRGQVAVLVLILASLPLIQRYVPEEKVSERVETIVPYLESTVGGGEGAVRNLSGRGHHLAMALAIFRDHPWVGVGYLGYRQQSLRYQYLVMGAEGVYTTPRNPHSSHFGILADLGILGAAAWIALLGVALHSALRGVRLAHDAPVEGRLLARAVLIMMAFQVPYGFYTEIHGEKVFWFLLGLVIASRSLAEAPVDERRIQAMPGPRTNGRRVTVVDGDRAGVTGSSAVAQPLGSRR